ncbi:MAG: MraY family glycosyltransferase [bacterium]|nr:MraY family glycosyltransferase [bacterium]
MNYTVNGHNVFLIVIVCFLSSIIFVQMMKKVAIFLHVLDVPNDKRKIHKKPMPLLGGLGIFFAFLLGYMLFAPKDNLMLSILISSFLIMLLGLFDDMTKSETPMPNKYKIIIQIIVACIVVFYGGLELTKASMFGLTIKFGIFSKPLSIFIIVACINAINLIDGLDGLCAGISSIYFLTIAIIGFALNKFGGLDIIISLMMLGCTLGYLVHNFPPAKIYQGDAGSTFCGLMIAVVFLLGFKTATLTSLIIPTLLLAIPIMDTLFAIIRRKLKGQKIDHADKEHLHHQLLKKFSKRSTLLVIYVINLLFSITSIFYALGHKIEVIICYIILMFIVLYLILKTDIIFERSKNK